MDILIDRSLIQYVMSVARMEAPLVLEAEITGFKKSRSITYSLVDASQTFCNDKNNIVQAHIQACDALLNRTKDMTARIIVEKEIGDLKIVLDLVKYVS
jgi:hypothetical protein